VLQHPIQLGLLTTLLGCLQSRSSLLQDSGYPQRSVDQPLIADTPLASVPRASVPLAARGYPNSIEARI
jgi:energy-converting hydrogenase Eha subunit F